MRKLVRNIGLVLAIIYIVPFIVYGIGSVLVGTSNADLLKHVRDALRLLETVEKVHGSQPHSSGAHA